MLKHFMNKISVLLSVAALCLSGTVSPGVQIRTHAYSFDSITGARNVSGFKNKNYQKVITVNAGNMGADNTGQNYASAAIQKALDYARDNASDTVQVKVIIPNGTYLINKTLNVYSNTYIIMNGAVLKKAASTGGCILRNAQPQRLGGYDDARNIIIEGGCFDGNIKPDYKNFCNVRMAHMKNLMMKNVSFKDNLNTHHLELGGIRDVTITGCDFSGYQGSNIKEALQFDMMNSSTVFAGFEPFDDTTCENVVIKNNIFRNVMRGIGSHSTTLGKYYKDFIIENNTFTNLTDCAILMQSYKNITVSGNTMNNVGSGIIVRNMSPSDKNTGYNKPVDDTANISGSLNNDLNTIIEHNSIYARQTSTRPSPVGIQLFGKLIENEAGSNFDHQVEGVRITDNTLSIPGTCIMMNDVMGIKVDHNRLSYVGKWNADFDLISVQDSSDTLFTENTAVTPADGGISVSGGRVYLQDMKLSNSSDCCCGVRSGNDGSVFGWDLTVDSKGTSSSPMVAEKGSGNMVISGGTYTSEGENSPAAVSHSVIAIKGAVLKGGKSEAVRVSDQGTMYLYDCQLSTDVMEADDGLTAAAVIYGDSNGSNGDKLSRLYVEGGSISSHGDIIFTTNCRSEIILRGTQLTTDSDGYILKCVSDPTLHGWGSGGARCSLILKGQELNGNMLCDSLSTLDIYLTEDSVYSGTPKTNSAEALPGDSGKISVSIDEGCEWVIDNDCTLSCLYAAGEVRDNSGLTAKIVDADGNILRDGDSIFTVKVTDSYSTDAAVYETRELYSFDHFRMKYAAIDPDIFGENDGDYETEEFLRGDLNGNGRREIGDVIIVASYVKQIRPFTDEQTHRRADINKDGLVNIKDVLLIAAAIKGLRAL
ncbi:glycosyl hydrolase family 28-related protein [Ruminococcus sp.]|uniref:glycosyl hydrolase family 28-related protein n=1 Tax=Ruminococcus sp. TaxID=41978 RepID=UPI00258F3252|nr:glycosyl hydrolase family 28-related protein [Ruminococcus sp.]MCR5021614.1 dockerin [Ruminococcus sp.]